MIQVLDRDFFCLGPQTSPKSFLFFLTRTGMGFYQSLAKMPFNGYIRSGIALKIYSTNWSQAPNFGKPQILLETIESISVIFPILKRHTNCFSKMQKNIAKLWYGIPLLASFCQEESCGKWNFHVGFQINILIVFS